MYETKLLRSATVAENTRQFFFERPEEFAYVAGQYVEVALIDPKETDAEGASRCFSLTSIPSEKELSFTTRMRDSAFKRVLGGMKEGDPIRLDGAFGSLTLHKKTERPAVFVAGGIGVTPFWSIIRDAAERKLPHTLTLFYSNRRPEDAPFLEELTALAAENPRFTLVPTMTQMESSSRPWKGECGRLNAEFFARHCNDPASSIWYLAGPPKMVLSLKKEIVAAGADEDDLRTEEFSGY